MNRLGARDEPLPAPARRQPGRLVPVGRRGVRAGARRGQADPALGRLQRVPLVPRDGARVVRGPGDRGADERALRQRQGRPRGAARRRRALHGRDRVDDRPGRLADDGVPHARRASRSTPARTSRPSRATGCRASASCSRAVAEAWRDAARRRRRAGAAARRRRSAARLAIAAVGRAARRPTLLAEAERGIARTFEPAYGGFGGAPKFPPASTLEFLLRRDATEALEMVDATLDGDGRRRHVRPRRRRLPPLLGRRPLARAALREDALRQRAARLGVPPRVGRHRRASATGRSSRRRSTTCCASCASPDGGLASAQDADTERRRGADVHVDGGRGEAPGSTRAARAVRARPLDHPRRARPGAARAAARRCARSGRSRSATTRRSPPGTASRSRRSPRPARRLERADWLEAARGARRSSCSARCRATTAGCFARVARGQVERRRASSTTTPTSRTGCSSSTSRPASRAGCTRRGGSRCSPSSSSRRRARRLLPRADGRRGARRAHEGRSTTTRRRPATRCSPTCSCGSAGSGATTSSSGGASASSGSSSRRCARAPRRFGWALCALDLWLAPPRELAIVGAVDSPVARAALAAVPAPSTVAAVGPADDVPLLAGKGLSTASRPCTSASASRARRPSPTRRLRHRRRASRSACRADGSRRATLADRRGRGRVGPLRPLRGRRRPAHRERHRARPRQAAAAFREPLLRQGRDPRRGRARGRDRRARADRVDRRRAPLYFAHLRFSTNMADPARGALVAQLGEKAAGARDAAPLLRARVGRARRRACRGAPRRPGARPLAPLAVCAAQVPPVPADGAGGEDHHREGRLGRLRLVAPLRGAARRAARRRSTASRAGLARDRDGEALRRRPRRAPCSRRGRHRRARARAAHAHVRSSTRSCSTSRSTTGSAATRPGSPPATSRTRRPTRPCRR